jgi:cell division protein ZapA
MQQDLSIKVNIAGRSFPLTVKPEEEENIRKAAKMVNDNINSLQDNYAVRDKIDLLSMTALLFATQVVESKKNTEPNPELISALNSLESKIESCLKD